MRAITVQNPWAWAIVHAGKTENRGRNTTYRGPIAIHAGFRWSEAGQYDARIERAFRPFLTTQQLARGAASLESAEHMGRFHFGAVIGLADLVDCHEVAWTRDSGACCEPWGDLWYHGSKGRRGKAWHLVFADVRPLATPVPALGKVMVPWSLPDDIAAALAIDVPFADDQWNEIVPALSQGGHDQFNGDRRRSVVVADEFDLVISLYQRAGCGPTDGVEHHYHDILDGALNRAEVERVGELADLAAHAVRDGRSVLVRCHAGYNRSGLVTAFTLMRLGMTGDEAIALIRAKRSRWALFNEHFLRYIAEEAAAHA